MLVRFAITQVVCFYLFPINDVRLFLFRWYSNINKDDILGIITDKQIQKQEKLRGKDLVFLCNDA